MATSARRPASRGCASEICSYLPRRRVASRSSTGLRSWARRWFHASLRPDMGRNIEADVLHRSLVGVRLVLLVLFLDELVDPLGAPPQRSEEHTSELQSLMRISYAVFCLKKKK